MQVVAPTSNASMAVVCDLHWSTQMIWEYSASSFAFRSAKAEKSDSSVVQTMRQTVD